MHVCFQHNLKFAYIFLTTQHILREESRGGGAYHGGKGFVSRDTAPNKSNGFMGVSSQSAPSMENILDRVTRI
jgi:hypothetical protein